ncbi:hypothetical protein COOONC_01706 [Cooperia oncophora]
MFDMLDVRLYSASHYILQESRNAELLEEVDEEDIVASVSPIQNLLIVDCLRLGLPSGRLHSACRLRLFLHCREMVHLLNALAEQLVTMPYM